MAGQQGKVFALTTSKFNFNNRSNASSPPQYWLQELLIDQLGGKKIKRKKPRDEKSGLRLLRVVQQFLNRCRLLKFLFAVGHLRFEAGEDAAVHLADP